MEDGFLVKSKDLEIIDALNDDRFNDAFRAAVSYDPGEPDTTTSRQLYFLQEENRKLTNLYNEVKKHADDSRESSRTSTTLSIISIIIAAISLVVAIIAIIL